MKKILFLLLISIISIQANEKNNTIIPISHKEVSNKKPINRKEMKIKLLNILASIKDYKKRNQVKTKRLLKELRTIKEEFQQYKARKNRELKRVKKEFQKYRIKKNKELKKVKNQLYSKNRKIKIRNKKLVEVQKKVNKQKPKKRKTIIVQSTKKEIPKIPYILTQPIKTEIPKTYNRTIHKVVHKMQPLPITIYDTPWIEIVVEKNINIYELALKYYGNKQEYKKIYLANQNRIGNDFKIYNGMSLKIPMTKFFKEKSNVTPLPIKGVER